MILHAGLLAVRAGRDWTGALIEGPSGSGKSDLALRAIGDGFRLVADDRTLAWTSGGDLYGRAPDTLAGWLEVRGVGVVTESPLGFCRIGLVVRMAEKPSSIERMPPEVFVSRLEIPLPAIDLWPFEPSAPAKIRRALTQLGGGG